MKMIQNISSISAVLLFTIMFTTELYSDDCSDSYQIEENFFNESIVGFYLGAIDIQTGDSNTLFFQYSIVDKSSHGQCYNEDINLTVKFEIKIKSPSVSTLYSDYFTIVKGEVNISNITSSVITFKNTELNFNTTSVPGADFHMNPNIYDSINEQDIQPLQNSILISGKIPNGEYVFNFELYSEYGGLIDSKEKILIINEPEYIHLNSPGGSISDTTSTMVYTSLPAFVWNMDPCTNCELGIRVCEYDPSIHSSLSDAINDMSVLPLSQSEDFYSVNANYNSLQYPSSGAGALQLGKLYVWQMNRAYQTTIGFNDILSDLFVFKIYNTQETQVLDPYYSVIKEIIGQSQYNVLFGEYGDLKGFEDGVVSIQINGQQVPISDLYQILSQKQMGDFNLQQVKSE